MNALKFLVLGLPVLLATALSVSADPPRSSLSELETDKRGQNLETLNGHFPFAVPDNADTWTSRSEALRRRVLVATGLWPMPEKTPLTPVIHGKIKRDGNALPPCR